MKRLFLVIFLLSLGIGGWLTFGSGQRFIGGQTPTASSSLPSTGTNASAPVAQTAGTAPDNALGLALQGISLFQGNKGAELWRLKASWAHLSQEGDVIDVDSPKVRYLLGDPGSEDFLDVVSQKGKVTDHQRYLKLWGDVHLTRFTEVLDAPVLDYDATTRVMVFPEGARLEGPTFFGTTTLLTWDLASNTLIGENGVMVVLKPQEPEAAERSEPLSTVAPAARETEGKATPRPVVATSQPVKKASVTSPPKSKPSSAAKTSNTSSRQKKEQKKTSRTTPKTPASSKPSSTPVAPSRQ